MKNNAILRIVLHSIAIVLLVTALCGSLIGCHITLDTDWDSTQNLGSGSIAASEIKNISIEWVSGTITVQTGDSDEITFTESSNHAKATPMQWKQRGDTLIIMFDKDNRIHFGTTISWDKDLTVTVPKNWQMGDFEIESVSADLSIAHVLADEISVETVSGETTITSCVVGDFSLGTVSGDADVTADFTNISIEAVSADCRIVSQGKPQQIEMEGVSGDLDLYLSENTGFTYNSESLSSSLTCDFPTTNHNNRRVYGDGSCRIEIECISGNVNILKAE